MLRRSRRICSTRNWNSRIPVQFPLKLPTLASQHPLATTSTSAEVRDTSIPSYRTAVTLVPKAEIVSFQVINDIKFYWYEATSISVSTETSPATFTYFPTLQWKQQKEKKKALQSNGSVLVESWKSSTGWIQTLGRSLVSGLINVE